MSRDREGRVAAHIAEGVSASGFELVDVEFAGGSGRQVIRVFIEKADGVNHGDCVRVSRLLGEILDADTALGVDAYLLEVSSPGIDRPLRTIEHFERFRGETAEVVTHNKIEGRSRHCGIIVDVRDGAIVLEQKDLGLTVIPLDGVKKANLRRDPWEEARKRQVADD